MPTVFIPASLRSMTNGVRSLDVNAKTVREAIDQLEQHFPGIRDRLCNGEKLKPGLSVAIDSRICHHGLLEVLSDRCEVHILPTVGGG